MSRKFLISFIVAALVLVPTLVSAQSDDPATLEPRQGNDKQNQTLDLKERTNQRKQRTLVGIDREKEERVKLNCNAAGAKLSQLANTIETVKNNRSERYQAIENKILDVIDVATKSQLDTAVLESLQESYATKKSDFFESFTVYEQAIADLELLDCSDDPESFYYAVQDARAQRKTLRQTSKEIKTFLQTEVRVVLNALRDQTLRQGEEV